jgi:hypothetical protein
MNSPVASPRPWFRADEAPALSCDSYLTDALAHEDVNIPLKYSRVPSVEPSSKMMTSRLACVCRRQLSTACCSRARRLYVGITTETFGTYLSSVIKNLHAARKSLYRDHEGYSRVNDVHNTGAYADYKT